MKCKRCPSYEVTVDPEGITWRRCRWDGHQVFGNMECDAHSIKIKAFLEAKEEMRKETHHMDGVYDGIVKGLQEVIEYQKGERDLRKSDWVVKHGHWEVVDETEPRRYGCSVCKRLSWTEDNYCSYCGCKMDEVEE